MPPQLKQKFEKIANNPNGRYVCAAMLSTHLIQELLREKFGKDKNILQLLGTAVKRKLLTDGEAIFIHQYGVQVMKGNKNIKTNAKQGAIRLAKIIGKVLGPEIRKRRG